MTKLLSRIWRSLPSKLQHAALFSLNSKFIAGTNIILLNSQGQVWLQKHSFWPAEYPWGLPGGHLNHHETPAQSVAREIAEELSAEIEIHSIIDIRSSHKRNLTVYYVGKFTSNIGQIDEREVADTGFFDPEHLPKDTYPPHRRVIQQYLQSQEHQESPHDHKY